MRGASVDGAQGPGGYEPAGGRILLGPMLTERQFARRCGLRPAAVREDRCIPRIASPIGVEPSYPSFMLDEDGLRLEVAFVALLLRRRVNDLEACDWLVRRNPALGDRSPLAWIDEHGPLSAVVAALPEPTKPLPASASRDEISAIRDEWLRFRGEETTPGRTIAWDRIARRAVAAPHGA